MPFLKNHEGTGIAEVLVPGNDRITLRNRFKTLCIAHSIGA